MGYYPIFSWHCLRLSLDKWVTERPAEKHVCPLWEEQSAEIVERDEGVQEFLQMIARGLLEMCDDVNDDNN